MDRGPSYSLHEDGSIDGWKGGAMERGDAAIGKRSSVASVDSEELKTPRIMDRKDAEMKRSKGQWNIRRVKTPNYWRLYLKDPFHTVVNLRLSKVIGVMAVVYIIVLVVFGALYTSVPSDTCKTAIFSFFDGFSFSVSVMFTIGFGTNGGDVFFGGCAGMQAIITVESLVGVLLDALAIGVIFARISRAQSRANTIVLSANACARRIRGQLYFMFQVCEMRKHQLVEAHVRMYVIRHDVAFGKHYYFQSYPMRIQHPDDDLGGMLLLALPSIVVHRMDGWSPLLPPKSADCCGAHHNPAKQYLFPEPIMRQADADSGDRDGTVPVNAASSSSLPCRCSPPGVTTGDGHAASAEQLTPEDIKQFWKDSQLEVVVLVEGIDAVTSATIQVRHSYRADEILFDHQFVNCVAMDPETGGAVIDFLRFHETEPADPECVKVAGGFY